MVSKCAYIHEQRTGSFVLHVTFKILIEYTFPNLKEISYFLVFIEMLYGPAARLTATLSLYQDMIEKIEAYALKCRINLNS